jgi:hypothetical protein
MLHRLHWRQGHAEVEDVRDLSTSCGVTVLTATSTTTGPRTPTNRPGSDNERSDKGLHLTRGRAAVPVGV